jgi:SAM-dependent methyltransferase
VHDSAAADFRAFVAKYLDPAAMLSIADIGSYNVNGALRELLPDSAKCWEYVGYDINPGPNVDVLLDSEDAWKGSGDFDVVISSQVIEHVRRPWAWMKAAATFLKPGGLIYVCTPNTWSFHEYPIDTFRYWPDGIRSLFAEAGLEEIEVYWRGPDTTGIGRRPA